METLNKRGSLNMNTVVAEKEAVSLVAEIPPLRDSVTQCWENYIAQLGEEEPDNSYQLFLEAMEFPLLLSVLRYTSNNQSRAAKVMGLSRGTLRKKLKQYGLL